MRVRDVMTTDVVTAQRDTPLQAVIDDLVTCGISGIPVVDNQRRVVGVVTEADIVAKEAYGPRHRALGLLARIVRERENRWVAKAQELTAGDVMTTPAYTAGPNDDVHQAAARMVTIGVKRLPVVDASARLVGIISRRDVMRLFHRKDAELAAAVRRVLQDRWRLPEDHAVSAVAVDGTVTLSGTARGPADVEAIERAVAEVPGVLGVSSEIVAREPERRRVGR